MRLAKAVSTLVYSAVLSTPLLATISPAVAVGLENEGSFCTAPQTIQGRWEKPRFTSSDGVINLLVCVLPSSRGLERLNLCPGGELVVLHSDAGTEEFGRRGTNAPCELVYSCCYAADGGAAGN